MTFILYMFHGWHVAGTVFWNYSFLQILHIKFNRSSFRLRQTVFRLKRIKYILLL